MVSWDFKTSRQRLSVTTQLLNHDMALNGISISICDWMEDTVFITCNLSYISIFSLLLSHPPLFAPIINRNLRDQKVAQKPGLNE